MKHITIQRAEQADLDAIMDLMEEAIRTVKESDWFLPDDRAYVSDHISDRGFTLKAVDDDNEILGFFIVDFPGTASKNLGYDLEYDIDKIKKVAHMDYAVVSERARGCSLQKRFFEEAEKRLIDTPYEYFLGTVHPDNIYSRRNFIRSGYQEAKQMLKYGGMPRIIMEKEKFV